jgi:hypothetical protein
MRTLWATLVVGATFCLGALQAAEFPGWQALRVIKQEGRPRILQADDLDGDGRQELIVVNNRSARLDVYSWLEKASRQDPQTPDEDQPNDLPLAPELKHSEIQMEHIPRDVLIQDLDGDGKPELVVLAAPPNQVLIYHRDNDGSWSQQRKCDLLEGEIPSRRRPTLLRKLVDGGFQLLVSLNNGIQQLSLKPDGKAEWLTPRERRDRLDWWLADLDGDGHEDLIEQNREAAEAIRWYRGSEQDSLAPAAVLYDRSLNDAAMIHYRDSAELALLDGSVRQLLRRYRLQLGEPSAFGERRPLAVEDGLKAVWCGMWQAQNRALVVADRDRPRLLSYVLGETVWEDEHAYPAVSGINALVAPAAEPGTLLIWAKDAADLLVSRWKSQRLTYPEPMPQSPAAEDRKILALASVGETAWWVQKVGKHLDLYRWEKGQAKPWQLRFENVSDKADEVLWVGGDRLLVKDAHFRGLKLAVHADGKTTVTAPTHLMKSDLSQYKLFAVGDEVRLGRLVEGVLQWIGDDLQSHEQIMLPQGQELADYVVTGAAGGWALRKESPFIHRIHINPSGLSEDVESIKVSEGLALRNDPVLGVLLVDHDRVTQLSEGRPHELKLVEAVDERIGESGGIRETKFHRLGATDLDGDGHDELLLYDDLDHRITALADREGSLKPKIVWPVFDDKVYPYGEDYESQVHEPRTALALDIDGDHRQDLALLCHDRLLIYLAREEEVQESVNSLGRQPQVHDHRANK